jgi:hypothetical protein
MTVPVMVQQEIQKKGTGNQDAAAISDRHGFNPHQKVDRPDHPLKEGHEKQYGAEMGLFMNFSPRNSFSNGRLVCHYPDIL